MISLLKEAKSVLDKFHTIWALIVVSIVWLVIGWSLLLGIRGVVADLGLFDQESVREHFYQIGVTVLILVEIAIVIWWFCRRRTPKFEEEEASVLFALHSDEKCSDLVRETYRRFSKSLRQRRLDKIIVHRLLSGEETIENHEEAVAMSAQSNAKLIVFGYLVRGTKNGKGFEGFESLSFHFRNPSSDRMRDKTLARALSHFPLGIGNENTIIERPILADSIYYQTVFFVALSLMSIGNTLDARPIWTELRNEVRLRHVHDVRFANFIELVESWWARGELSYVYYLYAKYVRDRLTDRACDSYALEILDTLDNCKHRLQRISSYYLHRSIQLFHLGRLSEARKACEKGIKKVPDFSGYFEISLGFLCLWRGMNERGLKHYIRAAKYNMTVKDASDCIDFLEQLYDRQKEKTALLFSVAFIRDHFHIDEFALEDYEIFVRESNGNPALAKLAEYSHRRMRTLKSSRVKEGDGSVGVDSDSN